MGFFFKFLLNVKHFALELLAPALGTLDFISIRRLLLNSLPSDQHFCRLPLFVLLFIRCFACLTNKVCNKERNELMHGRNIRSRQDLNQRRHTPKVNKCTIITELKRILSNAVVRYCISIGKQPCLKKWSPITHHLLNSSFIDDGKPYWTESPFLDIK